MTRPESGQKEEARRPAAPKRQGSLPDLPIEDWHDTATSLHLWTQIIGKIRLQLSPMLNHWWQTTLYLTPRGLTTSPMPAGDEAVQIDFDFDDLLSFFQSTYEAGANLARWDRARLERSFLIPPRAP